MDSGDKTIGGSSGEQGEQGERSLLGDDSTFVEGGSKTCLCSDPSERIWEIIEGEHSSLLVMHLNTLLDESERRREVLLC